jgi:hypothetical protein
MNDVDDADAVAFVITYLICVELSKEPEYKCEYCNKVYKQEARYITHIGGCIEKDTRPIGPPPMGRIEKDTPLLPMPPPPPMLDNTTVMELLRQNGEMLELLRKQQETIQMLVARQMER